MVRRVPTPVLVTVEGGVHRGWSGSVLSGKELDRPRGVHWTGTPFPPWGRSHWTSSLPSTERGRVPRVSGGPVASGHRGPFGTFYLLFGAGTVGGGVGVRSSLPFLPPPVSSGRSPRSWVGSSARRVNYPSLRLPHLLPWFGKDQGVVGGRRGSPTRFLGRTGRLGRPVHTIVLALRREGRHRQVPARTRFGDTPGRYV